MVEKNINTEQLSTTLEKYPLSTRFKIAFRCLRDGNIGRAAGLTTRSNTGTAQLYCKRADDSRYIGKNYNITPKQLNI